jgi:dihydrofolate reductase
MGKLVMFNFVTLEGFFAGPDGEIDWHVVDDEFNQFAMAQLDSADGLLFGRVTYELMAGFWPTPDAARQAPQIAARMNSLSKTVVSRTLKSVAWNNTRLITGHLHDEVSKLKQQARHDVLLLGSADLATFLTELRLIDEYRLMVAPVALGNGKPLFRNIGRKLAFKLLAARPFTSGSILLSYEPAWAEAGGLGVAGY